MEKKIISNATAVNQQQLVQHFGPEIKTSNGYILTNNYGEQSSNYQMTLQGAPIDMSTNQSSHERDSLNTAEDKRTYFSL